MHILAIDIGSSFAEVALIESKNSKCKTLQIERGYLPRHPLKTIIPKILAGNPRPDQVLINTRYIEKLFDFRLGGSLAQIVTKGFEGLPETLQTQGSPALFSSELIFGVEERVNGDGQITSALNMEQVTAALEEIQKKNGKRVCIHLINARMNPTHQNEIAKAAIEKGLDVFIPQANIINERQSWLQNILNAAVSGTFLEMRDEIKAALGEEFPSEKIFFINEKGEPVNESQDIRFSSIFGLSSLLQKKYPEQEVLNLGLEKFFFIYHRNIPRWTGPWGKFEAVFPSRGDLRIQPTSLIDLTSTGQVGILKKNEGFEPGPMLMGRGQKPLVADLYLDQMAPEFVAENGEKKLKQSILALTKNCEILNGQDYSKVNQHLLKQVAEKIATEVFEYSMKKEIVITGHLAELLGPFIQKNLPGFKISIAANKQKTSIIGELLK